MTRFKARTSAAVGVASGMGLSVSRFGRSTMVPRSAVNSTKSPSVRPIASRTGFGMLTWWLPVKRAMAVVLDMGAEYRTTVLVVNGPETGREMIELFRRQCCAVWRLVA